MYAHSRSTTIVYGRGFLIRTFIYVHALPDIIYGQSTPKSVPVRKIGNLKNPRTFDRFSEEDYQTYLTNLKSMFKKHCLFQILFNSGDFLINKMSKICFLRLF